MIFHQMDLTAYIGKDTLGWETFRSAVYDSRYEPVRRIISNHVTYIPQSPVTDSEDETNASFSSGSGRFTSSDVDSIDSYVLV